MHKAMKIQDDIMIELGGQLLELKPSLRHAIRLERLHGLATLANQIADGSLSASCAVIGLHCNRLGLESIVLENLDALREPLLSYLLACAGIDTDEPPSPQQSGDTTSISDHLTSLYRIATGWMSWTPQVALDCTPAEITLAYQGRLDMLKAIFGSSENKPEPETLPGFIDSHVKSVFASIGTTRVC